MGQKISPLLLRLGVSKEWNSTWYEDLSNHSNYSKFLSEEIKISRYFRKNINNFIFSNIKFERLSSSLKIIILTDRLNLMSLKRNEELLNKINYDLSKILNTNPALDFKEIKKPEIDAGIIASNISYAISQKRASYKKEIKTAIDKAMKSGISGIKIRISGRLNGAEIARAETFRKGASPLHKIRSDIDYSSVNCSTTYGILGIQVWVCVRNI